MKHVRGLRHEPGVREPRELFVEVFEATYVDVVRFAARRIDPGRAEDIADLAAAWQRLQPVHQESISLTAWDGLTGAEAAAVLGISPVAYRIRLTRARKALRALLDSTPPATLNRRATAREGTQ